MAVTRIGDALEIHSSTDPSSASVTVPDDAEIMVVGVGGWFSTGANGFTGDVAEDAETSALTLNSVNFRVGRLSTAIGADDASAVLYIVSPAIGSQTLAWNWTGVLSNGVHIHYAFYKGIDTTTPIRSRGGEQTTSATHVHTGTLAAENGDIGVAVAEGYTGASYTWTGVSELFDNSYNNGYGSFADGALSGNTEFIATGTASGYHSIAGVVLKQAAAGGGATTAPMMMHLARLRRR